MQSRVINTFHLWFFTPEYDIQNIEMKILQMNIAFCLYVTQKFPNLRMWRISWKSLVR
jgi:hypothetical protein